MFHYVRSKLTIENNFYTVSSFFKNSKTRTSSECSGDNTILRVNKTNTTTLTYRELKKMLMFCSQLCSQCYQFQCCCCRLAVVANMKESGAGKASFISSNKRPLNIFYRISTKNFLFVVIKCFIDFDLVSVDFRNLVQAISGPVKFHVNV